MARRVVFAGCLVALLAGVCPADKLILIDGRTFIGTVAVEGDTVLITVPYGTLRFPKTQVERIELMDTPEQEFRKKLGEAALDDPNALYGLAQWAEKNSLSRQAGDLYALVLKLKPDHAPTRLAVGFVLLDQRWLTFDQALQQARGKLEAGSYAALLDDVLPALGAAARTRDQQIQIADLTACTFLRSRQFDVARQKFLELTDKAAPDANSMRYAAIASILEKNPDGMYVLRETYPPSATLLGDASASIQPGPASLAKEMVLEAALRDLAKRDIAAGRALMDEAQKLELTDPDPAAQKYAQAQQAFDRADALVPDIARSYRVEIARRKIAAIRKDVKDDAEKFDQQMDKLGVRDLAPKAFKDLILRMIHHLDNTRDDLKRVLVAAKPFPRELVLEIKWAELDLARVEKMRMILVSKLDGRD
ncbi:MAG TPA: hypothetical protein VM695_01055 [Phycisphaerae bacterium]|nr:hypothetical protein [Phycisphaerae bacterium]